jgi:TonB family protein
MRFGACLVIALTLTVLDVERTTQGKRFSTALVSSSPLAEWQRYTVKGEEFSVSLPALPAMNTRRFSVTPTQQRIQRVLGSYADGVAYAIYTFENPQRQTLDEFIAYSRQRRSRNREWTNSTDVKVNEFSGKQLAFIERTVAGTAQFFRTNNHLYQFEAVGASIADPRVQQFFSSLMLGKKLEGTEVHDGIGAQPAEDPNSQATTFSGRELDQKVIIVTKPEPSYTESARQSRTTGTVVLRIVFAATGGVSDIQVVSGLQSGLTEQAMVSAKQIRFVPAMKNGQFVSTWLQVEYNFNLY